MEELENGEKNCASGSANPFTNKLDCERVKENSASNPTSDCDDEVSIIVSWLKKFILKKFFCKSLKKFLKYPLKIFEKFN